MACMVMTCSSKHQMKNGMSSSRSCCRLAALDAMIDGIGLQLVVVAGSSLKLSGSNRDHGANGKWSPGLKQFPESG